MEALHYLEGLKCPGGCGNYMDEAHSREWDWDVNAHKCYACASIDVVKRSDAKQNKGVDGWDDGFIWSAAPVAPLKPRT